MLVSSPATNKGTMMNKKRDEIPEYVDKDKFETLLAKAVGKQPTARPRYTVEDAPAVMPCAVCGVDVDISETIRIVRARRALCYDHQSHYATRPALGGDSAAPSFDDLLHLVESYNRANPNTELGLTRTLKQK